MNRRDEIKSELQKLVPILGSTACKTVSLMFSCDATIDGNWEIVDHLNCPFNHLITIGAANSQFSSLILWGVSDDAVEKLLGEPEYDQSYIFDIFGELLNTYSALLDDNEHYSKIFGKQIQTVPVLYSDGAPFIPFLQGVQGEIKVNNTTFYVGFVIRENDVEGRK